jgi:hypothetical protein
METANERILESTRQICNLYHDYIKLEEAVKLMRGQNIRAEFVKGIYNQLSADADNLTEERFHYYKTPNKKYSEYPRAGYWTIRYLLVYNTEAANPTHYEITIIDLFNDKSA